MTARKTSTQRAAARVLKAVQAGVSKPLKRQATKPNAKRGIRVGPMLDPDARSYAALLADPCYAPVAHPVYPGSDGGLLARFENEFTLATGATESATIVAYVPGAIKTSLFFPSASLVNDTTASTLFADPTNSPGLTFLQSSASAVRVVSACMQIAWPGSELNRQGFVALGQTTGAVATEAQTTATSVAALRPLCHLRTRMPETQAEVKFRPTLGDAEWTDPNIGTATGDINRKGMLLAAISNLPAGTGVRIRLVVTYEWQPKTNNGLASSYDARAKSSSSLDDVLNALDRNGPGWAYNIGRASSSLAGMTAAYAAGASGMGPQRRIRV